MTSVMDRRAFLAAAAALLAAPLTVEAQQTSRVPTIGMLSAALAGRNPITEAFGGTLHRLGWVRGQTVKVEARFAGGRHEATGALAAELVAVGVDVLVAWGPSAAIAAKRATSKIPVVFLAAGDPLGFGLVSSLARPEGNVTGISFDATLEPYSKGLELLKECVPSVTRVALLTASDHTTEGMKTLREAARTLKLALGGTRGGGPPNGMLRVTDPAPGGDRDGGARDGAALRRDYGVDLGPGRPRARGAHARAHQVGQAPGGADAAGGGRGVRGHAGAASRGASGPTRASARRSRTRWRRPGWTILGHKDLTMTLGYAHLSPGHLRAEMNSRRTGQGTAQKRHMSL